MALLQNGVKHFRRWTIKYLRINAQWWSASVVEPEPDFFAGAEAGEKEPAPACFAMWFRSSEVAE